MTLSITVPDDDDGWQWQLIKYAQIDSLAEENMSTETAVIMSSSSLSSTTISETNECNWGALLLTAVVTGGVVGNALVVLAVLFEKKLRSETNYYLVSLAVADLFVSLVVMPCCIVQEFIGW